MLKIEIFHECSLENIRLPNFVEDWKKAFGSQFKRQSAKCWFTLLTTFAVCMQSITRSMTTFMASDMKLRMPFPHYTLKYGDTATCLAELWRIVCCLELLWGEWGPGGQLWFLGRRERHECDWGSGCAQWAIDYAAIGQVCEEIYEEHIALESVLHQLFKHEFHLLCTRNIGNGVLDWLDYMRHGDKPNTQQFWGINIMRQGNYIPSHE